MNFVRKNAFYISISLLSILCPINVFAIESIPQPQKIHAKGAVLVEKESMRILWERNGYTPLPMASTTKIMTCIVALENGNLQDIVVTSKRASAAPKVKLFLRPGEKHTLEDLLYALMLESSNDAAVAIAEHIGGSVEEFCNMMTKKAKALGATASTFKTPNGLDAPGHMSSPYDLALISKYAYNNSEFIKIITTPSRSIPSKPLEDSRPHSLVNKNQFLNSYFGANGIKTGYTGQAGHCFVGGAKKDNMQLFAVVLGSGWAGVGRTQKYTDTIRLMDYGFKNFQMVEIQKAKEHAGNTLVQKGEKENIDLIFGKSFLFPLMESEKDKVYISTNIPDKVKAPISIYEPVGEAYIYLDNSQIGTLPILAAENIQERTIRRSLEKVIEHWINLIY